MHTFGSYSGLKSVKAKKTGNARRCHKIQIGVQPTAVTRRKLLLDEKRKISAGRPTSQQRPELKNLRKHDYTSFGSLPTGKRKAPHNLQSCVFDNKSLGA